MIDNHLSMGLASSPYIFTKLSNFIVRCATREAIDHIINYLDDFCIVGTSRLQTTAKQLKLVSILSRLGFYISHKKLQSPALKMRFLGIYIDMIKLELTLPPDKLEKLRRVLRQFHGCRKVRCKELERLGGLLVHCAKVIRGVAPSVELFTI